MARSIGRVEVGVDANTGRMTAQLRAGGETGGRAYANAFEEEMGDIDGRELLARLRAIRLKAEADLRNIEVDIGIDDDDARRGLRQLELRLRAAELELDIEPNIDTTTLQADLRALRAMIRDIRVDVKADVDVADVVAARALIDSLLGDVEVAVEPTVDDSVLARVRRRLAGWGGDAGDGAGRDFTRGFADSFSDGSEVAFRAILLFGDNVFAALEGPIGAIAALGSSAAFALGGIGGTALTGIANVGAVTAAAVPGMEGFGTALSQINEAFEEERNAGYTDELTGALADLSPNARAAARAFQDVRGELHEARLEIQDALFAGLDQTFRSMADESLPGITEALVIAAGSLNEFVRQLGEVSNNIDWVETMLALDPSLDNMFDAATDLAGVLPDLLIAAGPAAERVSDAIADAVYDFREWVRLNPDQLTEFFDNGAESLLTWTELIGSIGDLLGTVFGGGRGPGDQFVASLDRLITKWDTFLESAEGQTALNDFFEDAEQTLRDMEPFFEGLGEFITTLSEESGGDQFATLMESLGDSLPTIAEALALIGDLGIGQTFLDMLAGLQPVFDLLNSLPDELLKTVGTLITVSKTLDIARHAALRFGVSLETMTKANPYILAVGAALSAALVASDLFSGSNRNAEVATDNFAAALENNIRVLSDQQSVAANSTAAIEAFTAAYGEGDVGTKLKTALGELGQTLDDVAPDLFEFREGADEAEGALTRLATGAGLPADAARRLADAVNSTDFNHWSDSGLTAIEVGQDVDDMFGELAAQTGISESELRRMAEAMEQVQDEATNVELDKVAEDALSLALGGDAASKAMAEAALASQGLAAGTDLSSLSAEELVAVYEDYINRLYEAEAATKAAADANTTAIPIYQVIQDDIRLAAEESRARAEALREERAAQYDTYQQGIRDAKALLNAVVDVAESGLGLPPEFAQSVIDLGESWDAASAAATAYGNAMEVLRGGLPDLEGAISAVEAAADSFAEGVTETVDGVETKLTPALETLYDTQGRVISVFDLGEETGRAYAEEARSWAEDILAFGAASLQAGQDTEVVTAEMERMRDELENSIVALGVGETEAEQYVNALLGTPDVLRTVVETPGLIDALLNANDLTLLYDDAGNPVITEFEALGIDPALASVEGFQELVNTLDGAVVEPTIAPDVSEAERTVESVTTDLTVLGDTTAAPTVDIVGHIIALALVGALQQAVDTLNASVADPTIEVSDYSLTKERLDDLAEAVETYDQAEGDPELTVSDYLASKTRLDLLKAAVEAYDRSRADPELELSDYPLIKSQLDTLEREINNLPDAQVYISLPGIGNRIAEVQDLHNRIEGLRSRTITITTVQNGGGSLPGAMAGEIITGPTVRRVGEFGYREAIVPLDLPLSRVDPSVRELAALLRGGGDGMLLQQRPSIEVNQSITSAARNPESVANQVINRLAAVIGD